MTTNAIRTSSSPRIVGIVDDHEGMRSALGRCIQADGYTSRLFASAEALLADRCVQDMSCLIVDYQMPRMNGIELVKMLVAIGCRTPIVMISAYASDIVQPALDAGALHVISKQAGTDVLLAAVRDAIAKTER